MKRSGLSPWNPESAKSCRWCVAPFINSYEATISFDCIMNKSLSPNKPSGAARVKYTVGKVPQQDVLKAQIAYSQLADHELMFEREADMARAELNALMGRPLDQPLEVTGEYQPLRELPSQIALQQIALENRPELQALTLMKRQGGRKVQLAEKGYSPEYTVSAGYMLMPGGSMNRNAWMGELSISLPVAESRLP